MVKGIREWEGGRRERKKKRSIKEIILFDGGEGVEGLRGGLMGAVVGGAEPQAPKYLWSYFVGGVEEGEEEGMGEVPYSYSNMLLLDEAFEKGEANFFLVDDRCGMAVDINFLGMTQTDITTEEVVPLLRKVVKDPLMVPEYKKEMEKYLYFKERVSSFVVAEEEGKGKGGEIGERGEVVLFGERGKVERAREVILEEVGGGEEWETLEMLIGEEGYERKCKKVKEVLSLLGFKVICEELPPDGVRLSALKGEGGGGGLLEIEFKIVESLCEM